MTADPEAESEGQRAPTRRDVRGRARILIPLAAAFLALLAVLLWALRTGEPPSAPSAGPQAELPPAPPEETHSPSLRYEVGEAPPSEAPARRVPLADRPRLDERLRFEGVGVLEGRLDLPPGVPAPRAWSLVLEPSSVLIGGDGASARRVEFQDGELEFSLRDVPLGGYEIWAEAEGMRGRREHLLLARPDAQLVYQDLRLLPLAFVEGRVIDAEGVAVPGLPMFLRASAGSGRLETRTDGAGLYLFERVPDGEHRLEAGFPDAPLAAPLELAVVSPSLHVPVIEVPRLFELVARVLDADGLELAGARVRGWCDRGGRIDALSDAFGLARAPFIPAGRVTLEAAHPARPDAGFARVHADFPAVDGAPLAIRLQR
jgi:hypothetical protein